MRDDRALFEKICLEGFQSGLSWLTILRKRGNFRRAFADFATTVPTESYTTVLPDGRRALNYAVRKPVGVVAIVVPWNLPLLLLTWKVAPALACGNAVVVKPSEETPSSATVLAEVMADAGVPAGVFNLVHGFGPAPAGPVSAPRDRRVTV